MIYDGSPRFIVVFRNDDLSACSDVEHERRVAAVFERYRVPQTLGVIPFCSGSEWKNPTGRQEVPLNRNPAMVEFLGRYALRSGSEIALHGYSHRTNRFSIPSRREFFEFRELSLEEQEEKIRRGSEHLARILGVNPTTFVPPWNRLDANTVLACARNELMIVSSGPFTQSANGVVSFGVNCDLENFSSLFAQACESEQRVFLCVMYHSRTIQRDAEFESLERAVRLVADTPACLTLTIREAVQRFPDELWLMNEAAKNIVSQDQVIGTERARALVYRRALPRWGLIRSLESTYDSAQQSYRLGRYEDVHDLAHLIDQSCRRVLTIGRLLAATSGLVASTVLGLLGWRLDFAERAWAYAGLALLVISLGGFAWWRGTARDTKREVRCCTLWTLIAVLATAGLCEWLHAAS